jgi:Rod binding domain-containing protein
MDVAVLPPIFSATAADQSRDASKTAAEKDASLRQTAQEFEAVFIAEMLSHAGFEKAIAQETGLGGEAFSRMLVETYAEQLSKKGGFGLADQIYRQLKDRL